MRKSIVAIIGILTLQCFLQYGNIKVLKDDFKNQNVFSLELYSTTNFTFTSKSKRAVFVTFTKTVNADSVAVIKCHLSSEFPNHDQPLGNFSFFKLDEKKIKIKFQSTKIIPNEIRNATWNVHSAEFILSNELQNELLSANNFSVRFYSGEFPLDADFSSSDLRVIKELIRIKP
ncbi:hypothetical protein EHQ52_17095 [Leptospira koniambonensis]|uniref:Uncharacterized protein n=1 Tax=Leptospira koniambonensis TaxID=2484950 RepID=A0A4R9J3N9_9LEPT|nr:hypothetical protein [Leptospira koniambonensis]TGL31643.1 hypothetical protein EHQ52_17095 [Leptospira koniambonensis]